MRKTHFLTKPSEKIKPARISRYKTDEVCWIQLWFLLQILIKAQLVIFIREMQHFKHEAV